jgi:hypothetical protein
MDMKWTRALHPDMALLFLISYSAIVYEVFLPRFFSVILDYNFVFLVISLATFGLGLGGYVSFLMINKWKRYKQRLVLIYAFSIAVVVNGMYVLPFQGVWFYSLFALIPFFLSGWLLSGIFQEHHREVHSYYFSDLIGAGLGAVLSILLMNELNPIRTISLLTFILFLTYLFINLRTLRNGQKLFNSIVAAALFFNVINPFVELLDFRAYRTSPNTTFYEQPDADIVFTEWNAFARTDVFDTDDGELLYITIDGGAVSPISRFSGDLKDVDYLRATTSSLAFQDKPRGRSLIIGAGGGQEVLTAQMAGYSVIEAVDINGASFRAVQESKNFSGDVFNQSKVIPIVSDGRNYIKKTRNEYNVIYLSLVTKKSENGLGITLTENYIYTQEAIKEYLNKLSGHGRLAFLLHDEKELTKIMSSATKLLKDRGVSEEDLKKHIAVIGTYQHLGHNVWGMNKSQITRPLIIIQNEPFSQAEAQSLYDSTKKIQQIPVHIPFVYDKFSTLRSFLLNKVENTAANRDDKPFFYNQTNQVPWSLVSLLILAVCTSLLISKKSGLRAGQIIYFSGISIGFMLIEVTLVQRLILPLGHPTLAFVLVLGVLLLSGGIGSLLSAKYTVNHRRFAPLLLVGIMTLGVHIMISWLNEHSYSITQTERIWIIAMVLIPLGLFMGMPFPYGLRRMRAPLIGASWGLNGLMTVSGSIIAAMMSLTYGFAFTLLLGAMIYGFLFAIQPYLKIE